MQVTEDLAAARNAAKKAEADVDSAYRARRGEKTVKRKLQQLEDSL